MKEISRLSEITRSILLDSRIIRTDTWREFEQNSTTSWRSLRYSVVYRSRNHPKKLYKNTTRNEKYKETRKMKNDMHNVKNCSKEEEEKENGYAYACRRCRQEAQSLRRVIWMKRFFSLAQQGWRKDGCRVLPKLGKKGGGLGEKTTRRPPRISSNRGRKKEKKKSGAATRMEWKKWSERMRCEKKKGARSPLAPPATGRWSESRAGPAFGVSTRWLLHRVVRALHKGGWKNR